MTIQRADARAPTPAKLAASHAAANELRHQLLNLRSHTSLGCYQLPSVVIELLQHRHASANRCIGQTLTVERAEWNIIGDHLQALLSGF
jgi:hypothetical protein